MIPKLIHYVWVGDKVKPKSVIDCINSWKKYCPDYKIVEWNNDILKKIDCLYVTQAVKHKKWAFVSDYVRLFALQTCGGIYLDTDVELTASLDSFLKDDFFLGHENYMGRSRICVGTAVIGAVKNHYIVNELLDEYNTLTFEKSNGDLDMLPNTSRLYEYFIRRFGVTASEGTKTISLDQKCNLYPWWYFCLPQEDKENYAIHHFDGSWLDSWKRRTKLKLHFGKYYICFAGFSKQENAKDIITLPQNENFLLKLKKSPRKVYALIKGKEHK